MRITCRLEFDAGHRIPNHESQCQHLHGHRYAIEITLSGDIIKTEGSPQQGMVLDFSDAKNIARRHLVERWDHAFLVYRRDKPVVEFLRSLKNHKTIELDSIPTAENLSLEAFRTLGAAYRDAFGSHVKLERVRLYETPNCWADAEADD